MFIGIITVSITLTGCWNKIELSELAFVMGIGIDKSEDGKGYEVSFQVVIPGNVTTGMTGGGAQGLPFTVISTTAENLVEAGRKSSKRVSRRLYYAHTSLVVISDEVAKEGIDTLFDAMERDPEFRTTTKVVIAKDTSAKSIISTQTPLTKLPAEMVTQTLKITERLLGENIVVNIDDIIMALVSNGKDPFISGFRIIGNSSEGEKMSNIETSQSPVRLMADGMALFSGDKLVGWMTGDMAKGAQRIQDKMKATVEYVEWSGETNAIGMEILRSKTKVSASVKNGKPKILIKIEQEGNIGETKVPVDLTNPKVIQKLEKAYRKRIKTEVMDSVKEAQELNSDIFGFGEAIHKSNPKYWKKVKSDWNTQFADLQVEVKVDTYIRRTGDRSKSYLSSSND